MTKRTRRRSRPRSVESKRSRLHPHSPELFDKRSFESDDPWSALYIPAPSKEESIATTVRLSTSDRRKIETVLASQRTPWATLSDALRWLVYAGMGRMAEVLGDAQLTTHLAILKVEHAVRATEAKRVFLSRLTQDFEAQMVHLVARGEIEEAQRIFERAVGILESAPRSDSMTRRLLTELLSGPELAVVRKATGWKLPEGPRPS